VAQLPLPSLEVVTKNKLVGEVALDIPILSERCNRWEEVLEITFALSMEI
jgi:hypothetical protein